MANENPNPASSDIQVILAGNLADDDLMWIVRCSAREFQNFLLAPPAWVESLASLPGWSTSGVDGPVPAPVLLPDFALVVHLRDGGDPDGWITVQSISDTNEVTLSVTRDAAVASLLAFPKVAVSVQAALDAGTDPFAPFWAEAATGDRILLTNMVVPINRVYGHYEILTPGETLQETAARTLAMLLASATDPAGLTKMLSELPQRALYIDGPSRETGPALSLRASTTLSVVCANVAPRDSGGSDDPHPDPEPVNCLMIEGPHDPEDDVVIVDGVIVKRYGVEE